MKFATLILTTMTKPSYKSLFQALTYFGLVFGYNTCKLTLHHVFPSKSNTVITCFFIICMVYNFFTFWSNWVISIKLFSLNQHFTEKWRNSNIKYSSLVIHEAGNWSVRVADAVTMLLCIYQAWSQEVGTLFRKIRYAFKCYTDRGSS